MFCKMTNSKIQGSDTTIRVKLISIKMYNYVIHATLNFLFGVFYKAQSRLAKALANLGFCVLTWT